MNDDIASEWEFNMRAAQDINRSNHARDDYHDTPSPPPNPPRRAHTADRSPLTPTHDPNFLDNPLPAFDTPYEGWPFTLNDPSNSHFAEAYRPSPTPPHQNFLSTILNPAGLDHNRYSPFTYRNSPPTFQEPYAPLDDMPPSTRTRPSRLSNGYVDLTAAPDSPPRRRKRQSPTPGPSAKRQKQQDGTPGKRESSGDDGKVEEVDLTNDKQSVQDILQKQREDAVKSQTKPEEKPTTFNTFTCVICMDNPKDLTATACGHLFCHECLIQALIAGENRTGHNEPKRSQCPVCRKTINRTKASDVIPLLLMKGLVTQPRKRKIASPAAVAPKSKKQQHRVRKSVRAWQLMPDDEAENELEWI